MNLDEYGRGRQSVINEMIDWCQSEIEKIKDHGISNDSYKSATMSGQVRAYSKAKMKLKVKETRLINHKTETK